MALNKVILIGNVGKEPEIRVMNNGNEVAIFSLATTDSWKDKASGEKKDRTEWHRIVVYNVGLISIIKSYVKKGSKLYLEGSLQTRKWVDNQGVEKQTTEIILQGYNCNIQLLDSRQNSNNNNSFDDSYYNTLETGIPETTETNSGKEFIDEIDDNIPF